MNTIRVPPARCERDSHYRSVNIILLITLLIIGSNSDVTVILLPSLSLLLLVFLDVAMVGKGKPASVTTGSRDRTYVRK